MGASGLLFFFVLLLHLLCVRPLLYQTDRTDSGHFFLASLRSITVNGNRGWVVFSTLVWFVEPTLEGHSLTLPVRVKKVMAIFFFSFFSLPQLYATFISFLSRCDKRTIFRLVSVWADVLYRSIELCKYLCCEKHTTARCVRR